MSTNIVEPVCTCDLDWGQILCERHYLDIDYSANLALQKPWDFATAMQELRLAYEQDHPPRKRGKRAPVREVLPDAGGGTTLVDGGQMSEEATEAGAGGRAGGHHSGAAGPGRPGPGGSPEEAKEETMHTQEAGPWTLLIDYDCPREGCGVRLTKLVSTLPGYGEHKAGEFIPHLADLENGSDLEFMSDCGAHQIGWFAYANSGRVMRAFPQRHGPNKA